MWWDGSGRIVVDDRLKEGGVVVLVNGNRMDGRLVEVGRIVVAYIVPCMVEFRHPDGMSVD